VAVDRDIVGRIGEDRRGALGSHQLGMRRLLARIATKEPVPPEQPEVADVADGGAAASVGRAKRQQTAVFATFWGAVWAAALQFPSIRRPPTPDRFDNA